MGTFDLSKWQPNFRRFGAKTQTQATVAVNGEVGYSANRPGVQGRALLTAKNQGKALVLRLKDTEPILTTEIGFWASLLVMLAPDGPWDAVSNPPSSEKPGHSFHLATELAQRVAQLLKLPYERLFTNLAPRHTKTSLQAKLHEEKRYLYQGEAAGKRILMVDDVIHTGITATTCGELARPDELFWLFLYRA